MNTKFRLDSISSVSKESLFKKHILRIEYQSNEITIVKNKLSRVNKTNYFIFTSIS